MTNECAGDNGNCSHICHDTETSYYCSCKHGYKMLNDSKTCEGNSRKKTKIYCEQRNAEIIDVYKMERLKRKLSYFIDINECDIIGQCSQICTNTKGSYKCSCTSDYVLSPNGRNCNPTAGTSWLVLSKHVLSSNSRFRLFYILSLVNVKTIKLVTTFFVAQKEKLLVAVGLDVRSIENDGSGMKRLVSKNVKNVVAVGLHQKRNVIFWADAYVGKIFSSAFGCKNTPAKVVVTDRNIKDLAIDWITEKLYWLTTSQGKYRCASLLLFELRKSIFSIQILA